MIKILIVEDDPMVAELNKRYIESIEGFKILALVTNGKDALEFCSKNHVDLIILDVYMPQLDGINFLKKLRKKEITADVILVTASKEVSTIDQALKYGAVDYLFKPFEYERLKKSLINYSERRSLLKEKTLSKQVDIDKIFSTSTSVSDDNLQKGLHKKTLDRIRKVFRDKSKFYTSEEIAMELSLTRVTVRRYLEYLESTGEVKLEIEYGSIGRPTHLYKYVN